MCICQIDYIITNITTFLRKALKLIHFEINIDKSEQLKIYLKYISTYTLL